MRLEQLIKHSDALEKENKKLKEALKKMDCDCWVRQETELYTGIPVSEHHEDCNYRIAQEAMKEVPQ